MIKKEEGVIFLDGNIESCLNFNSPDLSDEDFVATIIEQLVNDDAGVRVGSTPRYRKEVLEATAECVLKLVNSMGLTCRDHFITAAYDQCTNSQPHRVSDVSWNTSPFLKGSAVANKYAHLSKP